MRAGGIDEIITPDEMARTLGNSAKTLRGWMRKQAKAGHPRLASHDHYGRWEFSRADADRIIAEFRGTRTATRFAPPQTAASAPANPSRADSSPAPPAATTADGQSPAPARGDIPALPRTFTREDLTAIGFEGWMTWPQLRADGYSTIPSRPGVYVIVRTTDGPKQFVHPGTGGWFQGKDPAVSRARLEAEWVDDAHVLNIGKADVRKSGGVNNGLRGRLREYGRFGAGAEIGHRGGRLIWQLADADSLLVGWHVVTWGETAREYEKRLLAAFAVQHDDRRPFANLTG